MASFIRIPQYVYQTVVYFCGFILFWEWLRPLETITDTGNMSVFIIFTGFCFFLSIVNTKWWLSFPLKIAAIIFIMDGLFIVERLFSREWFDLVYMHMQFNFSLIAQREWVEMTPLFRSLLFLLLLWLMSYLLYFWFVVAKRIFLFVLLTFIYVTVLDTFTIYDGSAAVVRTFVVSLVAMGLSSFSKELDKESIPIANVKRLLAFLFPLLAVVFFTSVIGFASPKQVPQWPDPVPFIQSTAENMSGRGDGISRVQKVGYGENDSRLGGAFIQDNTPVFRTTVEESHYWRIETKDVYTGKGWDRLEGESYVEQLDGDIELQTFFSRVPTDELQANVSFNPSEYFNKLVYPYGIDQVESEQHQLLLDENNGIIRAEGPEGAGNLNNYSITYDYPAFSIDQLIASGQGDPAEIEEQYLQLPSSLPDRVGELAEEIVADETTRYDRVRAIERFFRVGDFRYSTSTDVAIPGERDDYVDQFLFDTKVGYCDNFSTSMVVLLRSLDIPARWVKGFTSGERIVNADTPEGIEMYQVTNANAHSWVEVYFPNSGWVPFEPTQGFSNPVEFFEETEDDDVDIPVSGDMDTEQPERDPLNPEDLMGDQSDAGGAGSSNLDFPIWGMLLIVGGVVGLVAVMYITRYRWLTWLLSFKYRRREGVKNFQDAYHYLLRVMDHKGLKRRDGQTLREFARHVDKLYESTEMSRMTYQYELMLYRDESHKVEWKQLTELWENLMKRTLS